MGGVVQGISIYMYYNDHMPPHIHVEYGALYDFQKQCIIKGNLPVRVLQMLIEWSTNNEDKLMDNWNHAVNNEALMKIDPLT